MKKCNDFATIPYNNFFSYIKDMKTKKLTGLETHEKNGTLTVVNKERKKLQRIGCDLISMFMTETNQEEQKRILAEIVEIEKELRKR